MNIGTCGRVVAVLLLATAVDASFRVPPVAQGDRALPRVHLAARTELVEALRGVPDPRTSTLRFAFIAAQGRSLLPRLHDIVTDETEDWEVRANALLVLGFVLDSSSAVLVLQYASRPGRLRDVALGALQRFPYSDVCTFWRSTLRDRALHHSGRASFAVSGIRYCGDEADIGVLEAFVARGVTRGTRARVEWAIAELRRPKADRYRNTEFAGNYPPSGNYTPPPELAARIREQLCGGACPPGMVVRASAVAALREQ